MSRKSRHEWVLSGIRTPGKTAKGRNLDASSSLHSRHLRFEPLEDRRLLAVFTVTNTNDSGAGSLRQAILDANAAGTVDQIVFSSVTGTIALNGELLITDSVTITGPGADFLMIDQDATDRRVFNISGGTSAADKSVTISGLTITGGNLTGAANFGGGILSRENLTIIDSVISGNTSGSNGGGIHQYYGTLAIQSSTVGNNTAVRGGGVYGFFAEVNIAGSTISGNTATAGIQISGGGIVNSGGSLTIVNSTVSGNIANDQGGGINNFGGALVVRHSTITNNRNDANASGFGQGGGIFNNGSATLDHTIVAGNFRGAGSTRDDIGGSATAAFSFVGDSTGATITNNGGNQIGTGAMPLNPLLGPLQGNGGRTFTHALLAGSTAIDAGQAGIASPPASDQRGAPFLRVFNDPDASGNAIDIGAYERQSFASPLVVDTHVDENDGNYSAGDLSLREAIILANGTVGANTITFAAALSGQTIKLAGTELVLTEAVTIDATALAHNVTIDAQQLSRVFNITATTGDFTFGGLNITGGKIVAGSGGGVLSHTQGDLIFNECMIKGNLVMAPVGHGGGVYAFGNAIFNQSTIAANRLVSDLLGTGGGLHVLGNATFNQSTISGNSMSGPSSFRGVIVVDGDLSLSFSTIAENSNIRGSTFWEVVNVGGNTNFSSSIIAKNFSSPLVFGGTLVAAYTLLESTDGLKASQIASLINGPGNIVDPNLPLGPLVHNGGSTLTHALVPGSPAINAGNPAFMPPPANDQRGDPWSRVHGGRIDIGAYEWQPNPLLGDYNFNGKVSAADYVMWRDTLGSTIDLRANGDDSNQVIDIVDYGVWRANFGNTLGGGASGEEREASVSIAGGSQPPESETYSWGARTRSMGDSPVRETVSSQLGRANRPCYGSQARTLALLDLLDSLPEREPDSERPEWDFTEEEREPEARDEALAAYFAGVMG